ncbi:MAG: DNA oxidative demethylase AlkB [Polaromonas sp.]|nr:DNA oxidative demethylase AlkB [Polaromonas sp.]
MTGDLFADQIEPYAAPQLIAPGAAILRGFALPQVERLMQGIHAVIAAAPLRHLVTPGGQTMSVAMSNCGPLGWTSDRHGYRYTAQDPATGQPWPNMPDGFGDLAQRAALEAGFDGFVPNACLINRYQPGARMGLHQDRDEGGAARDFTPPIVSISLGLPAVFLFGGLARTDKTTRWPLAHGDVVVWGGPLRLAFHGVAPLNDGTHPQLGAQRFNLTFRCVRQA